MLGSTPPKKKTKKKLRRFLSRSNSKKSLKQAEPETPALPNADFKVENYSVAFSNMPTLKVRPLKNGHKSRIIEGPNETETMVSFKDLMCGRSVSTYPHPSCNPVRDGDPICDHFLSEMFENRVISCVADGCNWGVKPRDAGVAACGAFVRYMEDHQHLIEDTRQCGEMLLEAFKAAHEAILAGKEDIFEAGTTTLLGSMLLEVDRGDDQWQPPFIYICASVGDCKAWCYQGGTDGDVDDITVANRGNVHDARDCGGRLGPHMDGGKPDLRNLNIFCLSCMEGDSIVMVSDGVHDNLDPQQLGKRPKDMPREYNLRGEDWASVDEEQAYDAKTNFCHTFLQKLFEESGSCTVFSSKLVDHCLQVTQKSRDFMENEETLGKKLPDNYFEYPGKMDHTTIVSFVVGACELDDNDQVINGNDLVSESMKSIKGKSSNEVKKDNSIEEVVLEAGEKPVIIAHPPPVTAEDNNNSKEDGKEDSDFKEEKHHEIERKSNQEPHEQLQNVSKESQAQPQFKNGVIEGIGTSTEHRSEEQLSNEHTEESNSESNSETQSENTSTEYRNRSNSRHHEPNTPNNTKPTIPHSTKRSEKHKKKSSDASSEEDKHTEKVKKDPEKT